MRHFDLLLMRHPHLRSIDYQRLVQRVKNDPAAHWDEFVAACAPVVLTAALRLAPDLVPTEYAPALEAILSHGPVASRMVSAHERGRSLREIAGAMAGCLREDRLFLDGA